MGKALTLPIKTACASAFVLWAGTGAALAAAPDIAAAEATSENLEKQSNTDQRPTLGLMGTIPIYWGEADGLFEQISGDFQAHWARKFLEQDYALAPLDYLSADNLSGSTYLLLAQPRGFSPEENVALDEWVKGGGQLLLFADPWMTGYSRFSIADRRRPQGIALLSPILDHWGLQLEFDDAEQEHSDHSEAAGEMFEEVGGVPIPVNSPGRFVLSEQAHTCQLSETAILARCAIGEGSVVILADAAVLDLAPPQGAQEAFSVLLSHAYVKNGENAGSANSDRLVSSKNGGKLRFSSLGKPPISTGEPPG